LLAKIKGGHEIFVFEFLTFTHVLGKTNGDVECVLVFTNAESAGPLLLVRFAWLCFRML